MDEKQNNAIREILAANARAGVWLPFPESFFSGEEIGFDLSDVKVRANVIFTRRDLTVEMTSPVRNQHINHIWYKKFTAVLNEKPNCLEEGGQGTDRCINKAKEILIGLYTDWMILHSRRDDIRSRLDLLPNYAANLHISEVERIAPLKERIRILNAESASLKKFLQAGEIRQEEYSNRRHPIHEEIVALLPLSKEKDPFMELFREEIDLCKYAEDKRALIESFK